MVTHVPQDTPANTPTPSLHAALSLSFSFSLSLIPSEAQAAAEERTQRQINPRQPRCRSRSGSAAQLWRSANVAVRTQRSLRNLTEVAAEAALTAQQQRRRSRLSYATHDATLCSVSLTNATSEDSTTRQNNGIL